MHAWFIPSVYEEAVVGRGAVTRSREATRLRIEEQLARGRSAFPAVEARLDIVHAQPVDALLEASRHADLLVLGRRRHGMVHLGRLTRSVLRRARCPVAVVAPKVVDTSHQHTPPGRRGHRGTKTSTSGSSGT